MREWWAAMGQQPAPLRRPGYQAYAVLTMCRILYTLDRGTVTTKPVAARWTQERLGERWAALIENALAGPSADQRTPADVVAETLALIHYMSEQCRPWDAPAPPAGF